ncbi:hypothetical protein GCM10010336_69740 [Streptomyces goshikiensis]|nr:hypothetical protein GCM10010336_69740 [Streptomyces goshikiensis]
MPYQSLQGHSERGDAQLRVQKRAGLRWVGRGGGGREGGQASRGEVQDFLVADLDPGQSLLEGMVGSEGSPPEIPSRS